MWLLVAFSLLYSNTFFYLQILFIHSVVGHLDCFQFWGIIESDAKSVLDPASWCMCTHTCLVCVIVTLPDKDKLLFPNALFQCKKTFDGLLKLVVIKKTNIFLQNLTFS